MSMIGSVNIGAFLQMKDVSDKLKKARGDFDHFGKAVNNIFKAIGSGKGLGDLEKELGIVAQRAHAVTQSVTTSTQKRKKEQKELNQLLKLGAITQKEYNAAVKQLPRTKSISAFNALKPAIVGVTAAFAGLVAVNAKFLHDQGKTATRLGTTVDQLQKLQYIGRQTGATTETMTQAAEEFQRSLQEAATDPMSDAAVGFKQLGLDVNALIKQSSTDLPGAMMKAAGAMSGIKSHTEKAAAAAMIFKGAGQEMIGTISAGPEKLDELNKRFDELGPEITELDRINIDNVYKAFDDISESVGKVAMKIASELSPYITTVVTQFTNWAKDSVSSGSIIEKVFGAIGGAIGFVANVLQTLKIAWKFVQLGAVKAVEGILFSLGKMSKGIDWVSKKLGQSPTGATEALQEMKNAVADQAGEKWNDLQKELVAPSWKEQIDKGFGEIKQTATEAAKATDNLRDKTHTVATGFGKVAQEIDNASTEIRRSIATWNMSEPLKQLWHFRNELHASEKQLAEFKALARSKNDLEVFKEFATPLEKFQMLLQQTQQEVAEGVLSGDAAARKIAFSGHDLLGDSMTKNAAAMEAGSAEARSTVLNYAMKSANDPTRDTARSAAQLVTLMGQNNQILGRMAAAQVVPAPANMETRR